MNPNSRRIFILSALFIVTFSVPVFAGLHWSGYFCDNPDTEKELHSTFPEAFEVSNSGDFLRIPHSQDLEPKVGEDFLLLAWFYLKKLPQPGQKLVLLSKYDPKDSRLGYAVGLSREVGAIRPIVYWADSEDLRKMSSIRGADRWYEFPELQELPRGWFLFVVTFHQNHLLGVHFASFQDPASTRADLQLLGGYDVGEITPPFGSGDIVVGAFQDRAFRGAIGPLAILRGANLAENFKAILKAYVKDPQHLPSAVDSDSLKLWIPNKNDGQSETEAKADFVSAKTKKRREQE